MPNKVASLPILSEKQINRFWSKVAVTANPDKCWEWRRRINIKGYGQVRAGKNMVGAHRVAFFIHNNQDPLDKFVCHSCDNRSCVNPNHLWIGTNADNIMDCKRKGRLTPSPGSKNGFSKLTESQVLEIRRLRQDGVTSKELAEKFKTDKTNIWLIVTRKHWNHI